MNPSLVSILLPTFNGASYIGRSIESVLAQEYDEWELIVIDDGSTDATSTIVEEYVQKDARIKYIVNKHNSGIQRTLNRGIEESRGTFLARIDDDDEWIDTSKIAQQVAFLQSHPEYILVGTNAQIVDETGNVLETYTIPQYDAIIRRKLLSKNCFLHPTIMMCTSAVQKIGGYSEDTEVRHIEDYALWLALGLLGKFANLPSVTVRLMVHTGSTTFKNRITQAKRMRTLISQYKEKYPGFVRGYVLLSIRILGFVVISILPIPKRLLYWIQRIYKE